MSITRRRFLEGTAVVALSTLALAIARPFSNLIPPAVAQEKAISPVELLQPSALGDRQLGPDNAPVTIVEYASLTCPHCAHFAKTTFPELKKRYIDTGKVRYIFREFALNPLDAGAIMLARCVDKDKYFAFIDVLYHTQDTWVVQKPIEPLLEIAKQAGFTKASFDACLKNQKLLDQIEEQRNRASEKFGVSSTPTFFINGKVSRGAMSIEEISKLIDSYLAAK